MYIKVNEMTLKLVDIVENQDNIILSFSDVTESLEGTS